MQYAMPWDGWGVKGWIGQPFWGSDGHAPRKKTLRKDSRSGLLGRRCRLPKGKVVVGVVRSGGGGGGGGGGRVGGWGVGGFRGGVGVGVGGGVGFGGWGGVGRGRGLVLSQVVRFATWDWSLVDWEPLARGGILEAARQLIGLAMQRRVIARSIEFSAF